MLNSEFIQDHIPYYLTQDAKDGLVKAPKDFPEKINYYTNRYPKDVLQGDGWGNLAIIRFENGEKDYITGILLSNTCDMDSNKRRDFPANITFAPIVEIKDYVKLLTINGLNEEKVNNKALAIKEQKVSSIFYLPKNELLGDDCMALLTDLHTLPLSALQKNDKKPKLFTLSQVGFYLFLFKLSVHFCRFHENVER